MTSAFRHSAAGQIRSWAFLALAGALALGVTGCSEDLGQTTTPNTQQPPPSEPTSATYRLENRGRVLVDSAGTRVPVNPKLVTGYVDSATQNGDFVDLSGWAAPADLSAPAEIVVAVVGKASAVTAEPSGDRPDLVKGYNRPGLARAGFAMSIPRSELDCSAPKQGLKTFAVAGSAAGQLEWLADVPKIVADAC
jgi:hypothetical protein